MASRVSAWTIVVLGQNVGDTGASVVIVLLAIALIIISAVLAGLALWLWKVTKVEAPALTVLEAMSSRRFAKSDEATRTTLVEHARSRLVDDSEAIGDVPSNHE